MFLPILFHLAASEVQRHSGDSDPVLEHSKIEIKSGSEVSDVFRVLSPSFTNSLKNKTKVLKKARSGADPIKNFLLEILLFYAGIWPIREATIGHVTYVIGQIPA